MLFHPDTLSFDDIEISGKEQGSLFGQESLHGYICACGYVCLGQTCLFQSSCVWKNHLDSSLFRLTPGRTADIDNNVGSRPVRPGYSGKHGQAWQGKVFRKRRKSRGAEPLRKHSLGGIEVVKLGNQVVNQNRGVIQSGGASRHTNPVACFKGSIIPPVLANHGAGATEFEHIGFLLPAVIGSNNLQKWVRQSREPFCDMTLDSYRIVGVKNNCAVVGRPRK